MCGLQRAVLPCSLMKAPSERRAWGQAALEKGRNGIRVVYFVRYGTSSSTCSYKKNCIEKLQLLTCPFCTCPAQNAWLRLMGSQNITSWKAPIGVIESNLWLHIGPPCVSVWSLFCCSLPEVGMLGCLHGSHVCHTGCHN